MRLPIESEWRESDQVLMMQFVGESQERGAQIVAALQVEMTAAGLADEIDEARAEPLALEADAVNHELFPDRARGHGRLDGARGVDAVSDEHDRPPAALNYRRGPLHPASRTYRRRPKGCA